MHSKETGSRIKVYLLGFIGLAISLGFLIANLNLATVDAFYGAVRIDAFSTYIKIIMVLGTAGSLLIAFLSNDIYGNLKSEFAIMAVGVLVGGMLLASANNLLTLYLGIETLSILSYVLSSFKRKESASTEAGLKYALYGGVTAGIMLYGMSHIYGILGTIQFNEMALLIQSATVGQMAFLIFGFLLFFAGIGYKISCVPFHMWSPDVYQGAPIPVTAFFSIVPKMAGIAVLLRVSMLFFGGEGMLSHAWVGLLHVITALTMTVGNVSAIGQESTKRLLAFSSIGHVGFMLMGVLVLDGTGATSLLFYGTVYLFMTLVAFYIVSIVNDTYGTDSMTVFKGLIKRNPFITIIMSMVMFSLAGLPPFGGFVAKFNLLSVVVNKGYYGIAFVAAINSVIGLFYYMKLVREMIFSENDDKSKILGFSFANQAIIAILFIPVIFLGLYWDGLMSVASASKFFIR